MRRTNATARGTARLWEVAAYRERTGAAQFEQLLAEARSRVGRRLTDEERKQFLHE